MELLLVGASLVGFLGLRSRFASMVKSNAPEGEANHGYDVVQITNKPAPGMDRTLMMVNQRNFPFAVKDNLELDNAALVSQINPRFWEMLDDPEMVAQYAANYRRNNDHDHRLLQPEFMRYPYAAIKTNVYQQGHPDDVTQLGHLHIPQMEQVAN